MGFGAIGVKELIKLDDTPSSYSGQGDKFPKVKVGENGVEFSTAGIAGIRVRKDFGGVIGTRPQLNLIQGVGMGLKVSDNPPDDEVDIEVSSQAPYEHMILLPEDAVLPTANPPAKAIVDGANFSYETLDFDQATEEKCPLVVMSSSAYKCWVGLTAKHGIALWEASKL